MGGFWRACSRRSSALVASLICLGPNENSMEPDELEVADDNGRALRVAGTLRLGARGGSSVTGPSTMVAAGG